MIELGLLCLVVFALASMLFRVSQEENSPLGGIISMLLMVLLGTFSAVCFYRAGAGFPARADKIPTEIRELLSVEEDPVRGIWVQIYKRPRFFQVEKGELPDTHATHVSRVGDHLEWFSRITSEEVAAEAE